MICRAGRGGKPLATAHNLNIYAQGEHPKHRGVSDASLLGTVERYFVAILPIPRLGPRIHAFALSCTFAPTLQRARTP